MKKKLTQKLQIVFKRPWWAVWIKNKKYIIPIDIYISNEKIVSGIINYDVEVDIEHLNKEIKKLLK